jgi:hypothetical protein
MKVISNNFDIVRWLLKYCPLRGNGLINKRASLDKGSYSSIIAWVSVAGDTCLTAATWQRPILLALLFRIVAIMSLY